MRSINALRDKVAKTDAEIIRLMARRFSIAQRIGRAKKSHGIPLRNWQVEKTVIKHARMHAAALDVPVEMVTRIMQMLISESRTQQERKYYSICQRTKESVLVIGGLGSMGTWFSHFFSNQGHNVAVCDPRGASRIFPSYSNLQKGLEHATAALIATPLEAVAPTIDMITDCHFPGLAFDIASLKDHLRRSINKARRAGIMITSIHPLFGPDTRILSDKVICVCDCGDPAATRRAVGFFKDSAAAIVRLSFTEHDRAMSYILGLSHLVNILFMQVLSHSGLDHNDLNKVASTTFRSQVATAASVIFENPNLYHAIQERNPFRERLLAQLGRALNNTASAVRRRDPARFAAVMEASRHWFADSQGDQ